MPVGKKSLLQRKFLQGLNNLSWQQLPGQGWLSSSSVPPWLLQYPLQRWLKVGEVGQGFCVLQTTFFLSEIGEGKKERSREPQVAARPTAGAI